MAAEDVASGRRTSSILVEAERIIGQALRGLREAMQDPRVNEIMINHCDSVFVERAGQGIIEVPRSEHRLTEGDVVMAIQAVMKINAKDTAQIMDARLDGMRVAAALPPVAIHGPMMVIRKHAAHLYRLEDYLQQGAFKVMRDTDLGAAFAAESSERARHEAMAADGGEGFMEFLRWAVRSRKNLVIAGGTSSGKTTLASSCLAEIPDEERIITCEDTHEIQLLQRNTLQLEALPGIDGRPEVTIRNLIRLCLRSRPDRIIVGEIRGAEAYDFLDAMNTGHPGSICTIHANSAAEALSRLETLIRMSPTAANLPLSGLRSEIASAIHYVVYQSKEKTAGRAPRQVIALDGVDPDGNYRVRVVYDRFSSPTAGA